MFHEGPENSPIVSLTIRKDQVESVCVNWVTSDGKTPTLSSLTQNSGDNLDRVVFLHLVLNVSFHEITTDVPGLTKHKNPRSIYFAFENVSDTLMGDMIRQMDYIIHKVRFYIYIFKKSPRLSNFLLLLHLVRNKVMRAPKGA